MLNVTPLSPDKPAITPTEQRPAEPVAPPPAAAKLETTSSVYFSPVIRIDPETERSVLVYRDARTGEVVRQYPSERKLKAYREPTHEQQALPAVVRIAIEHSAPTPVHVAQADAPHESAAASKPRSTTSLEV